MEVWASYVVYKGIYILLLTENSGSSGQNDAKFIFKSSSVKVSVVKRPVVASKGDNLAKLEERKQEEEKEPKNDGTSTGLQSLCQYYESDEDN